MVHRRIEDFDLKQIAISGQCFRMKEREDGTFQIIAKERYLEVYQEQQEFFFSCTEEEYETIWKDYFDLSRDYGRIKHSIDPKDSFMTQAVTYGGGIRILKQDLWEMIITFIISQQNNIKRIKKCVETLSYHYGEKQKNEHGEEYYLFPTAQALSKAEEEDLYTYNLGYRSKYIIRVAKEVAQGDFLLEPLYEINYEEAKKQLLTLYGVGIKVAECICLFALHHIEAFPIDTHIKQILERYYPKGFPFKRYEGYAGILQQYAFYYKANGLIKEEELLLPKKKRG